MTEDQARDSALMGLASLTSSAIGLENSEALKRLPEQLPPPVARRARTFGATSGAASLSCARNWRLHSAASMPCEQWSAASRRPSGRWAG
jgi:hypothetical protein